MGSPLSSSWKRSLPSLFSGKAYRIVLLQYERDGYGLGTEEHLHWAFALLKPNQIHGKTFQVFARQYSDERGLVWESYLNRSVALDETRKCLGGVEVGVIAKRDLHKFHQVIAGHPPVSKFEGWNCRDWIVEVVSLLAAHGWAASFISDQAAFLPSLKHASRVTKSIYDLHSDKVPATIVPLERLGARG
ncbi:hypothetical protein FA95DRAFT_515521 [Auriscalpium vulgare]|uniref:Uncharacterized protein n=1 Tax=Auriscalpium vulgare TaxID=40419 RepID=A0ACB8RFE6_9AGAM|nr:hypothetical protein FA95DRAFT_515521 [Auriscalpium vulgare]